MPNEIITTYDRAQEYFYDYMAQIARQAEDEVAGKAKDWLNDERGILKVTGAGIDESVLVEWITEAVRRATT